MRNVFLRLLAMVSVVLLATAHSSADTLRLVRPDRMDPATQGFVEAFTKSSTLTSAGIELQEFPIGAIVAPGQVLDALEKRVIDLALLPYSAIVTKPTEGLTHVSLLANPTLVATSAEQFAIEDSTYGDRMAADLGQKNLVSLAFWDRSSVPLFAKKSLKSWEDLKGQKIASFDANTRRAVEALGGIVTQAAGGDIFAALERGAIDASEIAPSLFLADPKQLGAYKSGTLVWNFRQPLGFLVTHQNTWLAISQQNRNALSIAAKDAQAAARRLVSNEAERLPGVARESQLQVVSFTELGKFSLEGEAANQWLREVGDSGRPAFDLLKKVKLEMLRSPQPQRGGSVAPSIPATILFATVRNDEQNPDLAARFGLLRGENPALSCGGVSFALPADRKLGDEYGGPISLKADSSIAINQNCYKMFGEVADRAGGNLIIYVHGFWNSMAFAVRRMIAFATDLQISAPIVTWSWPSADSASLYQYDEDSVDWARIHFQNTIRALLSDTRIRRLTLISHSMGGRLACMGLETANAHARQAIVGNAVFAAPDVIAPNFRQCITYFGKTADRVTLYSTSTDRALLISTDKHHEDLAGLAGDKIVVMHGLETVDATAVESFLSTNHSYAFNVAEVLVDLKTLLTSNSPAANRGLKTIQKDGFDYWAIRKGP